MALPVVLKGCTGFYRVFEYCESVLLSFPSNNEGFYLVLLISFGLWRCEWLQRLVPGFTEFLHL